MLGLLHRTSGECWCLRLRKIRRWSNCCIHLEIGVLQCLGASGSLLRIVFQQILLTATAIRGYLLECDIIALVSYRHQHDSFVGGIGNNLSQGCGYKLREAEIHLRCQSDTHQSLVKLEHSRQQTISLHALGPGAHGRRPHDRADFIYLICLRWSWEQGSEGVQLCHDAATGKLIYWRVVIWRTKEDFRCTVPSCRDIVCEWRFGSDFPG